MIIEAKRRASKPYDSFPYLAIYNDGFFRNYQISTLYQARLAARALVNNFDMVHVTYKGYNIIYTETEEIFEPEPDNLIDHKWERSWFWGLNVSVHFG
jgi:hypothetical protein